MDPLGSQILKTAFPAFLHVIWGGEGVLSVRGINSILYSLKARCVGSMNSKIPTP